MEIISERLRNISESETLAMTRKARKLADQGFNVINLSIGEPDFNTPDFIKNAAIQAINENKTHYPPVSGYKELRTAISRKFKRDNNLNYQPEQIVVSCGAKQSIANAMLCLINPGDEVIVPVPYWVSYKEIIKLANGEAVYIPTTIKNDFKITPEQLEAAITPKTKVLIYSSPCNPTGSVYSKEELLGIAEVIAKHKNIFIISDEIYELIDFGSQHESIAQFDFIKDQVITINGVSKSFAMTGWRIGYLGAPVVIAKACDKLQGQITSATSSISQYAALEALLTDPATCPDIHEMVKIFNQRRNLVLDMLKEIPGIRTNLPKGAFYVFPNVSYYYGKKNEPYVINNANDLCMYILEKVNVALVPGNAFGDPNCIRLSYATSGELLIEAINRIKKALNLLNK